MLDELREVERLGKRALQRSSYVDLAELVRSTAESLRGFAIDEEVTLNARCAATSVIILADAADLAHVVNRLLSAALASSVRGGSIDCQLSVSADWIRLLVHTKGADADPSSVPVVLESSAERPSERGLRAWKLLGLSTVRTLVELHGGRVRVESHGRNSTFTVSLPGDSVVPEPPPGTAFEYPERQ
jgi:signal transduction histidine kinase